MALEGGELRVEYVTVRYRSAAAPALSDVSISVPGGVTACVVGPSGSGKSTLLRVIAGLQSVERGRVLLDGRDLSSVPPHRRGIGMMFQSHALFPHLDVGGNVAFGLRMQGVGRSDRQRRVAEALRLVGLGGWESRRVGTLSGGEQQRVALARTLAPSPRAILLDEPLGALDRELRERLVPELRELFHRLGITVVHVTHDHSEAMALADHLVVMDAGRVMQAGSPDVLWREPASEFVARFLGIGSVVPASHPLLGARRADGNLALVRGDAVELVDPGRDADGKGRIVSTEFRGAYRVVHVELEDHTRLVVRVAPGPAVHQGASPATAVDLVTEGRRVGVRLLDGAVQYLPS